MSVFTVIVSLLFAMYEFMLNIDLFFIEEEWFKNSSAGRESFLASIAMLLLIYNLWKYLSDDYRLSNKERKLTFTSMVFLGCGLCLRLLNVFHLKALFILVFVIGIVAFLARVFEITNDYVYRTRKKQRKNKGF